MLDLGGLILCVVFSLSCCSLNVRYLLYAFLMIYSGYIFTVSNFENVLYVCIVLSFNLSLTMSFSGYINIFVENIFSFSSILNLFGYSPFETLI